MRAAAATDLETLWDRLAAQPFFVNPSQRDGWCHRFCEAYPEGRDAIIGDATRILRHEFDLLGSGPVQLGPTLPWHTDFKTGREWPVEYWSDIEYAELDRPTDVKVPWELSRCQHFARLGQAYWLTDDDRFAREFVEETSDWIARNPYAYGVNWACAMDVALRAVSWIWGFYFMAEAPSCRSREFQERFLPSLFLHGEFISTHLECGDVNGNHYLCDAIGLVFAGCVFRSTEKGRRWLETGRDIVVAEIFNQVTPDGVDFEQSTAYHRLVLEGFSTAYHLLRLNRVDVPPDAWKRLELMHEYVLAYTKPDGRAPLIGDADNGRIQILGTQPTNDHRYLLSNAVAEFGGSRFKAGATRFWEESFWTFGPAGLDRYEAEPDQNAPRRSVAFPAGGFFVMQSDAAHLIVDCGDVGLRGTGGHGHNDILSFELYLNGFNVVTDCGAYLYTASPEWRNRFRSTAFHNSVEVDGEEVNRFLGPNALWQLHHDAVPISPTLDRGDLVDRFVGGHRGYERLADPVIVTREIVLDRSRPRVAVRDRLDGQAEHTMVWRFHLEPSIVAETCDMDVKLTSGERVVWLLADGARSNARLSLQSGWVSPGYGVKTSTSVVMWEAKAALPSVTSFLFAETRLSMEERNRVWSALCTLQ